MNFARVTRGFWKTASHSAGTGNAASVLERDAQATPSEGPKETEPTDR